MKIFYVIKWILRSFLFLLLLDLVVEPAVMAPNQKGNQDCTKLSEQRFLPETSPALNVEEENHAPKLNQISRKRVKRGLHDRVPAAFCRKKFYINKCKCSSTSTRPVDAGYYEREYCKNIWINQTCLVELNRRCEKKYRTGRLAYCTNYAEKVNFGC
ncbi:unnamed protein product [Clavelina lepadiformis]|uniref:Uncharacterized protein n=1 Tax=Clavelina lepadiformis TaxID=159417 RepID=A0ABP0FRE7_CLALP